MSWKTAADAPENIVVMTKIDDANGARNEQALKRKGWLWYYADESMYVYYTPTHWRSLTDTEREAERAKQQRAIDAAKRVLDQV